MRSSPIIGVLFVAIAGSAARADEVLAGTVDKALDSGPALGLGAGSQTSGLGLQLDYYLRPRAAELGLAVYVGAGVMAAPMGWTETTAFAAGLLAFVGHHHRFVVDVGYGRMWMEQRSNEAGTSTQNYFAASVSPGYEYMAANGLLFRVGVGVGYILGDHPWGPSGVTPTANLALGFKIR